MLLVGDFNLFDVVLGCVGIYTLKRLYSSRAMTGRPPLPPGPKPKPAIGNLLDMPSAGQLEWMHWAQHKDLYGPISSLSIMGQHIIIINDLQVALELLDKKSSVTSDRPASVFGGIMCGWENSLAMTCHGERFRMIRRGMHHAIGSGAALRKYHALEETEAKRLMLRILDDPDDLAEHIRRAIGAIILSISHGYAVEQDTKDPLVSLADECLAEASLAFQPGSWAVDLIPALRHLPDWFPGTGFKKVAERMFAHVRELLERPHAFVKQQMSAGTARPSFTQEMLEKGNLSPEEESVIKWAAAAIYGGGADSTVSVAYSFFLAMLLYPDVQQRAQAELDHVVGTDRLPTYADRERLPYVNALVKEALRWNAVLPMGVPHVVSEDGVEYSGYSIPKGAIIMPNISLFAHDPSTYSDPNDFKPERFLPSDGRTAELDPRNVVFGFGRRVCPGRDLADLSLFTLLATSLAVFDIRKPTDANGRPIEQVSEWTPGLISRPRGFRASIKPRSEKATELLRAAELEMTTGKEKSDAETLLGIEWEISKSRLH